MANKIPPDSIAPFIYPYHFGPVVADYNTALLWFGQLFSPVPGWLLEEVLVGFFAVVERSTQTSHSLAPLLRGAKHYLDLAQEDCLAAREGLAPLKPYLPQVMLVYPGTEEEYDEWETNYPGLVQHAVKMLGPDEINKVAATELIWRLYELSLVYGNNPDVLLALLDQRAQRLGSPFTLLAEGILNRHSLLRRPNIRIVTDHPGTLALLELLGRDMLSDQPSQSGSEREAQITQLAFFLFDEATSPHTPLIEAANAERLAGVLAGHTDSLVAARRKCNDYARRLIAECPTENVLSGVLKEVLADLEEEVAATLQVNTKAYKNATDKITESPAFWGAVLGLVGSAVGGLPAIVPAAAAVTAISVLGAAALKAGRDRSKALSESSWSFVYYLNR
jgi:hypothetical protein